MPLKITLKPHEKALIGTAVIANGATKAELVILNKVPVLKEREVITPDEADTVAKKIYVAVLNMYANPRQEKDYHDIYFSFVREFIDAVPNETVLSIIMEMSQRILEGDHYQALKVCRKLIEFEQEVLSHGQGKD
ncbi:MAG: flagellar biosynthesis repressor FlbT [Alphaproteobacteria bacterium]|nr:flagellar biosynthesis repressor FlbT [Alphaproteobacteria bacterium]MBF0355646.1 flagellar biosynthesis repressor FlbT [Alphaproteobacteria bacterium]